MNYVVSRPRDQPLCQALLVISFSFGAHAPSVQTGPPHLGSDDCLAMALRGERVTAKDGVRIA